jgi:hypothetical protein
MRRMHCLEARLWWQRWVGGLLRNWIPGYAAFGKVHRYSTGVQQVYLDRAMIFAGDMMMLSKRVKAPMALLARAKLG